MFLRSRAELILAIDQARAQVTEYEDALARHGALCAERAETVEELARLRRQLAPKHKGAMRIVSERTAQPRPEQVKPDSEYLGLVLREVHLSDHLIELDAELQILARKLATLEPYRHQLAALLSELRSQLQQEGRSSPVEIERLSAEIEALLAAGSGASGPS